MAGRVLGWSFWTDDAIELLTTETKAVAALLYSGALPVLSGWSPVTIDVLAYALRMSVGHVERALLEGDEAGAWRWNSRDGLILLRTDLRRARRRGAAVRPPVLGANVFPFRRPAVFPARGL